MIQEILDAELSSKEKHQSSGLISPSALGQCYRRVWWARKNEPVSNPPDNRTLRVFAMGHMVEKFVVDNLLLHYPDWQTQVEVTYEDVHGYADIVSPDEVMDVKSQHSRKFWWNTKEMQGGKDIKDMFMNNWLQVMTYAWYLNKPKARLIFVSKDDLCIQEYALDCDDYWKGLIDEELTKIRYYCGNKTIPPATPRLYWKEKEQKFGECEYCGYKDLCKEKENAS
jgi:DNA-directed RNA polymerase subunit RPC12/RpoP